MKNQYILSILFNLLFINVCFGQIYYQKNENSIRVVPPSVLPTGTIITPTSVSSLGTIIRLQAEPCGTPSLDSVTIVNQPWFGNNQFLLDFINSSQYSGNPPSCPTCRVVTAKYRIPIKAWIYRRSDGSTQPGDITPLIVEGVIRELNVIFNQALSTNSTGIQFYLNCNIDFVNNTRYYEDIENNARTDQMFSQYRERGHINIHFINTNDDGFAGRAARGNDSPSFRHSAAINTFESGLPRTIPNIASILAHEIGHVFNLDHTHDAGRAGWNNNNNENGKCYQESVNRDRRISGEGGLCAYSWISGNPKKCEINGDRLCDTDADPDIDFRVANNCAFTGGGTDKWGDSWIPPTFNIMSYSALNCLRQFTPMQVAVMDYMAIDFFNNELFVQRDPEIDIFEPNNLWENAQLAAYNQDQLHTFHWQPDVTVNGSEACDVDWVRFTVNTTQQIEIETKVVSGKPIPNTQITLFRNDNGTLISISADDDAGESNLSKLTLILNPGDYRVRINQKNAYPSPESRGHYYVKVANVCYAFENSTPSISGPDAICTSGSTYTLQGLPAVSPTITWSAGSGVIVNSSTGFATAQSGFNGTSTITATISSGSCNTKTITKTVRVGRPATPGIIIGPTFVSTGDWESYDINPAVGATSYQWSIPGDWIIRAGATSNRIDVEIGTVSGNVSVSAINACGQSVFTSLYVNVGGAHLMQVYPNPTDEYVEISPDESIADNKYIGKDFEVKLYDNFGQLKLIGKTVKANQEKKLKIRVKDLAVGLYLIHILHDKNVIQKQLQVVR